MQAFIAFLRLIRWPNLLYIALTQYLLRYGVLFPVYTHQSINQPFSLTHGEFGLLVLSTILIAAAGYIINDYFDVKADEINKPNRIFIDRYIDRRTAILWHSFFNIAGIGIGFYLGWKVGFIWLGFIHVFTGALLWYYSTHLKKIALLGNLSIAFLSALVVLIVLFFETSFSGEFYMSYPEIQNELWGIFKGYFAFAFLLSLLREVVKDMEDMEGDLSVKNKTLPILAGIKKTKYFCSALIVVILGLLSWYLYNQAGIYAAKNESWIWIKSIRYLIISVGLPLLFCLVFLYRADRSSQYKMVSNLIKLVMLAGILYLLFIMNSIE